MVSVNQSTHLSQEQQRHTQDRAIEGQPVHTLFHGSSKQHLVEGHHSQFQSLLRQRLSAFVRDTRTFRDHLGQLHGRQPCDFGNFQPTLQEQGDVEQLFQVLSTVGPDVRGRPVGVQQGVSLFPGTDGVRLDPREVLQILD